MIKRYMKLFIGLIIAAVISIAVYICVSIYRNNENKKLFEQEAKKAIFNFESADVTTLKVHNSDGDYVFEYNGDFWTMTEGADLQPGSAKLSEIAVTMSTLSADSILTEEKTENLQQYGLDDPLSIQAVFKDGTQKGIEIGKQVPGDSKYYLKVNGSDTIYLVSSTYVDELMAEKEDLTDRYMFNINNSSDINYLKYTLAGEVVYELSKNEDNEWSLLSPDINIPVNSAGITDITTFIIRATCATFVESSEENFKKYGFDSPQFEIEVKTPEKSARVLFGNNFDGNEEFVYAYNPDIDQMYIFSVSALGVQGTTVENVLTRTLHNEYRGNIDAIDIDIFGTKIKIDYGYNENDLLNGDYAVNGNAIDNSSEEIMLAFSQLFNSVTGMVYDKADIETKNKKVKGEPECTIVYELKDGTEYKLEFIPQGSDSDYMYIVENGKYLNVLESKYSFKSGILAYYDELMSLIEK